MIYAILHKNNPSTLLAYPLVIGGLWLSLFLNPSFLEMYYDATPMPLYAFFSNLHTLPYVSLIVVLCVMSINAFILSRIQSHFRIIEKGSNIYITIFFLLCAACIQFQQFGPLHVSLIFVLFGISSVFHMYKNEFGLRPIFEAGLLFSIAGLFYAPAFFLSVFCFLGLLSLVPFNWRQWMSALFGILTPIALTFSVYFLYDSVPHLLETLSANILHEHESFGISKGHIVFLSIMGIVFLRSLLHLFSGVVKKVSTTKYFGLLLFYCVLITAVFFAVPASGKEVFFFMIIPFVFILSHYIDSIRSYIWKEIVLIALFAGVIAVQVLA